MNDVDINIIVNGDVTCYLIVGIVLSRTIVLSAYSRRRLRAIVPTTKERHALAISNIIHRMGDPKRRIFRRRGVILQQ